jgi:hypothetical protein
MSLPRCARNAVRQETVCAQCVSAGGMASSVLYAIRKNTDRVHKGVKCSPSPHAEMSRQRDRPATAHLNCVGIPEGELSFADCRARPHAERLNLEHAVALHVYRIAEEALSNSIKHAKADKIHNQAAVVIERRVALTITDDGKGFIESPEEEGMGLQNIKYRAEASEERSRSLARPVKERSSDALCR